MVRICGWKTFPAPFTRPRTSFVAVITESRDRHQHSELRLSDCLYSARRGDIGWREPVFGNCSVVVRRCSNRSPNRRWFSLSHSWIGGGRYDRQHNPLDVPGWPSSYYRNKGGTLGLLCPGGELYGVRRGRRKSLSVLPVSREYARRCSGDGVYAMANVACFLWRWLSRNRGRFGFGCIIFRRFAGHPREVLHPECGVAFLKRS